MLLQLSQFFPLNPPPPSTSPSLRLSPHHCSCPWVMCIRSLASPFPILYFTSPWLFWNYLFVLLNPLTSSPILPYPPSHLFNLGILIMICLGVSLFASVVFDTLCASWTCMSISLTKLGKFSFIIFSNRFTISYSFSSPAAPL